MSCLFFFFFTHILWSFYRRTKVKAIKGKSGTSQQRQWHVHLMDNAGSWDTCEAVESDFTWFLAHHSDQCFLDLGSTSIFPKMHLCIFFQTPLKKCILSLSIWTSVIYQSPAGTVLMQGAERTDGAGIPALGEQSRAGTSPESQVPSV